MDSTTLSALNAYQNQIKLMSGSGESSGGDEAQAAGGDFMKMVKDGLQSSVNTMNQSEALQTQSLSTGKVDLSDLITAVSNAELTLNTVVAIRDKVIGAYQDIIRMSI